MTLLSTHEASRVRNLALSALHHIAAETLCEVPDIIALITPSQPEAPSKPHAPAAQTDGEAVSPPAAPPSVAPTSSLVRTADEQARHEPIDEVVTPPEHVDIVVANSLPGAECAEDRASIPEAPKPLPDDQEMRRPAEAKTSEQEASADASGGVQDRSESTPPSPSKRQTKRQQVIDCHEAHPDWTSFQIAEHLGYGAAHVQVIAGQCGIKLPRAPRAAPENMRDRVLAVVAAHPELTLRQIAAEAGCSLGTASKWAKEALGKAPQAEAPSSEPQTQPEPELPPLSKPSERLRPLVENDVTDVLHRPRKQPTGRFYLREKAEIGKPVRYVHQSLSACPTGPGPLMTLDRKWAWFDTIERYRGALVKWPQITSMIKEAVQ